MEFFWVLFLSVLRFELRVYLARQALYHLCQSVNLKTQCFKIYFLLDIKVLEMGVIFGCWI